MADVKHLLKIKRIHIFYGRTEKPSIGKTRKQCDWKDKIGNRFL